VTPSGLRCRSPDSAGPHRGERFGLGHRDSRGAAAGGRPQPGITADAGEADHTGLCLLDGEFVGQSLKLALSDSVIVAGCMNGHNVGLYSPLVARLGGPHLASSGMASDT
jgi:hypothetical protein